MYGIGNSNALISGLSTFKNSCFTSLWGFVAFTKILSVIFTRTLNLCKHPRACFWTQSVFQQWAFDNELTWKNWHIWIKNLWSWYKYLRFLRWLFHVIKNNFYSLIVWIHFLQVCVIQLQLCIQWSSIFLCLMQAHHLRCLNDFIEAQMTFHSQSQQYMSDLQKQLGR